MVVVIFTVLLLVGGAGALIGYLAAKSGPRLKRPERKELERLRQQETDVIDICLDNMDVELFARVVYDTICASKRKELG